MKKACVVILLLCFAALSACGGQGSADYSKNADLALMSEKALAVPEAKYSEMVVLSEKKLANFYPDIDPSQIEAMIVTLESARANADEFTVFKVKDTSYIESVKAAMKSHSDEMLVSVLNYKPDEVTRINNALVAVKGKYVFYIISEDNVKVEAAIETLFK